MPPDTIKLWKLCVRGSLGTTGQGGAGSSWAHAHSAVGAPRALPEILTPEGFERASLMDR